MKFILILSIAFVIWLVQKFAENYKQQQENRPQLGTPRKPAPPPRKASKPAADEDAWQDWIPTQQALENLPKPPPPLAPAPPVLVTQREEEETHLKPVGAPPPPLESEVAKTDSKVEAEIAHDLASNLAAGETAEAAAQSAAAATAGVMKTSMGAAFLQATRRARRQLRPGQPRIRLMTRRRSLLRQSLVLTEVLGRPRAFDV